MGVGIGSRLRHNAHCGLLSARVQSDYLPSQTPSLGHVIKLLEKPGSYPTHRVPIASLTKNDRFRLALVCIFHLFDQTNSPANAQDPESLVFNCGTVPAGQNAGWRHTAKTTIGGTVFSVLLWRIL